MGKQQNAKKSEQLGMSFSTAQNRLRKQLMFSLVQETGRDKCFQCGKVIEDADNLSIEHKEPWLDSKDPIGNFYALDNIAFSHTSCNYAAARKAPIKRRSEEAMVKLIGRSGFVGVQINTKPNGTKYRARIWNGKNYTSHGYYDTPQEAALEADKALIEAFGKDVTTNKSLGLL
ncbi:hypothetical protein BCU4_0216 [Bacillus phage BCU4]|uniref:HNH domain-containing protein n=1 Tax=Bacillus phage BCU4 TaxID=1126951 RepID=J9PR38_9CAUD|nr:hypothetical protein QLX27_gp223 [Bacillus phage BCU4]AEW47722.1 hypothetical protein BCU4_0216 [Bacillus phage BCU4]